jgi:hypothetical protein
MPQSLQLFALKQGKNQPTRPVSQLLNIKCAFSLLFPIQHRPSTRTVVLGRPRRDPSLARGVIG